MRAIRANPKVHQMKAYHNLFSWSKSAPIVYTYGY